MVIPWPRGGQTVGRSIAISVVNLPYRFFTAAAKSIGGLMAAIRARLKVFVTVGLGVFVLDVFLPPLFSSLARKAWDYFAFNPWLSKLPEYLASSDTPLQRKLEFLPNLALFWFSANDRIGFVEWGFTVDVGDLLRFVFNAFIVGAYFALWFYRRDQVVQCGWVGENSRRAGCDFRGRLLWLDRERSFRSCLSACGWSCLRGEKEKSWSLLDKRQVAANIRGVKKTLIASGWRSRLDLCSRELPRNETGE